MSAKEGARVIHLDKYLADTGAASRREAKAYIRRGEVTVDGVPTRARSRRSRRPQSSVCAASRCAIRPVIITCSTSPPASSPRRPTAASQRCSICSRRSCGALGSCPRGGWTRNRPVCCSSRTTETMSTVLSRRKSMCRRSISRARMGSRRMRMQSASRRASSSATGRSACPPGSSACRSRGAAASRFMRGNTTWSSGCSPAAGRRFCSCTGCRSGR